MKITINAQQPTYDTATGIASIHLAASTGATSQVSVCLESLLSFANLASKDIVDFFLLSTIVYGVDRFIERRQYSVDGWSRELKVKFPVTNLQKWKLLKGQFESLLSFLTGDYWEVDFSTANYTFPNQPLELEFADAYSQVNLFSGGLDSLIGAIDFLNETPNERVLFVSHYDSQMRGPKRDQSDLLEEITKAYPNQFSYIRSVKVSLENPTAERETTFRSRSFLFIGIALLAAQGKNIPLIVIPENGTVSLNYPLSSSRRSACSTRTTHPTVIDKIRSIWEQLNIETVIINPYEFCTKGEMVKGCKNQVLLQSIVKMSNSCGKRGHRTYWEEKSATHCGVCMPCVYRRASLLSFTDNTTYGNKINDLYPFKSKKAQDVGACLDYLRQPLSKKEIKEELIVNGVKDLEKIDRYTDVVVRTRAELTGLISKIGNRTVKDKAGI